MSELTDRFSSEFREEHRAVRDGLLALADALQKKDSDTAQAQLSSIAVLTGPHFRYEEEALYPALVPFFGSDHVKSLYHDHDGAIAGAERLVELVGQSPLGEDEIAESTSIIRSILPHVSDCDGLSIMVERLSDGEVEEIFAARDRCNDAGLDLLSWASEVRKPPQLQTL